MNNTILSRARLRYRLISVTAVAIGISGFGNAAFASGGGHRLVNSIVKAPIVADGDVAFRQSDFVINLAPFADPTGEGIALQAGDQFIVKLPAGILFDNLEDFPICSVGQADCASPSGMPRVCVPGTVACTTAVFLQGYPQSAVPPDVSRDGRIIILTARADTGPVIKQVHFIGKGTSNPHPGHYAVRVAHKRGDAILAKGVGRLRIRPHDHPSINITSVFASISGMGPPFANTVLQEVSDGLTTYPWNFLVWDHNAQPFMDLTLRRITSRLYLFKQGRRAVGWAWIDAPRRSRGFSLDMVDQGPINTPVIGVGPGQPPPPPPLTQRYTIQFDAGDNPAPGCYRTTLRLNRGNHETLFVGVPTADACARY